MGAKIVASPGGGAKSGLGRCHDNADDSPISWLFAIPHKKNRESSSKNLERVAERTSSEIPFLRPLPSNMQISMQII